MIKTIKVNPFKININLLKLAVENLIQGKLIIYPTETFYALGADPSNAKAIKKIFDFKERNKIKPILLIISNINMLTNLVSFIPYSAKQLINFFWPGPLTIIFKANDLIHPILTAGTGKIGIRYSNNAIAHKLSEIFKGPITATSANISNTQECTNIVDIKKIFDKKKLNTNLIKLIINGGITKGNKPSTIIDVTTKLPTILRNGIIPIEKIKKICPLM